MRRLTPSYAVIVYLAVLVGSTMAGCSLPPERRLAEELAASGQWDEAVAVYRQAARQAPFNESVQRGLHEAKQRAAEQHFSAALAHRAGGRLSEALHESKLALSLDPAGAEYAAAISDIMRLKDAYAELESAQRLQRAGRLEEALSAYERAMGLDPNLMAASRGITALTEQQRSAQSLGQPHDLITLRFQHAKLKEVFEVLARTGNINVLFDKDVRDEPITVFIKDRPLDEALNLILTLQGLFAKRLAADTLLIVPNTKQKQEQYEDLMIRTFYLSNARAKDMVNLVRTMLESKRVYVNEQMNAIVIRDSPIKLQLADRILQANDRREAEVELDVEVLEVNRTKTQELGLAFAKKAGAGAFPSGSNAGISTDSTGFSFKSLTSIGPSSYLFSIPSSILLDFFKQESDAKTLASPKLRVLNNKQASVNVGDKQPVLLSTTNVLPGQAATGAVPTTSTVTSIEFKDTGVKLTVEPVIQLNDEVTLKLKIEVTKIGDLVTLQASPEIKQFRFGTRSAETTLNVRTDESVVLAGLIQDEDRKTRVTVPGIGDIPVLGRLFSSTKDDSVTTEVILTITPHVVRNVNTPMFEAQSFWSGTEATYAVDPLFGPRPVTEQEPLQVPSTPTEDVSIRAYPSGAAGELDGAAPSPRLEPADVGPRGHPQLGSGGRSDARDVHPQLGRGGTGSDGS